MPLALSPPVYAILRGHIEERIGIHFSDDDRDVFVAKVAPRVEEAGFESFLDYYYFLRYDAGGEAELAALVEHLVVRESYLFREADQLRTLVQRWIAPRVREGQRLRLWSAASSTGDEPLSVAVLLAQEGVLDGVELVASDLSQHALDTARRGRFGRRSLRALREGEYSQWLQRNDDGSVSVAARLVEHVDWRRVNLLDREAIGRLGRFDVILCRNVLIYFSDATTSAVIESLTSALRPDGVLLVSVTESLLRYGTRLACEEHAGVFFYRCPAR